MGRIRTIKPELPQSESMGNVSRDARLCFILLFKLSDDHGKLRGNSRMLASLLFPYDDDAPKLIDRWLGQLQDEQCIIRYEIDGAHYVKILNWEDHQKVDHASKSKIPEPPEPIARIREDSRGLVVGSKDQGSRIEGGETPQPAAKPKRVGLEELSTDHISQWLVEKRREGKYLKHDERFVLEQFKGYCQSKGKTYTDYVAAYRLAFEWEKCQPKTNPTSQPTQGAGMRTL